MVPRRALVAPALLAVFLTSCGPATSDADSVSETRVVVGAEAPAAPADEAAVSPAAAKSATKGSTAAPATPVSTAKVPLSVARDTAPSASPAPGSATPSATPAESSAAAEGRARIAAHLAQLPLDGPGAWDLDASDFSGYDPTATVSWIVLVAPDPDGTPARQVVLVHDGEPVQTTFARPTGFVPQFSRVGADSVAVSYRYASEPETVGASATYTWDEAADAFHCADSVATDAALSDLGFHAVGARASTTPVAGAAAGAGGPVPLGSAELEGDPFDEGVHVVTAPAGAAGQDIGCSLTFVSSSCAYLGDDGQYRSIALPFTGKAGAPVAVGTEFPLFTGADGTGVVDPPVLAPGELAHYGPFVFAAQDGGMTVWNSMTGHGFVVAGLAATRF